MTNSTNNEFDRFALADRMRRAGVSQLALSQESGISKKSLSQIMTGKVSKPQNATHEAIEKAMKKLDAQSTN